MEAFTWDQRFETGLEMVDHQHRHLVDLVNVAGNILLGGKASEAELQDLFSQLADYAIYHFNEEERLMVEIGVDPRHVDAHKIQHREFLKQVTTMWNNRALAKDPAAMLHGFLSSWLTMHILGQDQEMARNIARIRAGENPAAACNAETETVDRRIDPLLEAMERLYRLLSVQNRELADANATLQQAKLEVEQASRGKDEFLAAISHELKTPLNHILGFSDLLKEGLVGELSAEQQGMAQDIFDAGSKQLAIVNALIELAKLQAGKMKLQAKPEDAAKLLEEIAARYAAKAKTAGLALAVEVPQGLGEMPLDREVVTRLLDQLLDNACKFTPSGGKVSLVARRVPRTDVAAPVRCAANEYLELAVIDNGPGIAPEVLPRLFQPFVQGDGRRARSHQGTGIGLVLVRLLAELHGGGSAAHSEPGSGAKFLVWLPIDQQQQP
ncbi:MAG: bacteriohemerythrin [Gallionella sp.]|nr:bacteriohemerythrin [Gallionella sp.]